MSDRLDVVFVALDDGAAQRAARAWLETSDAVANVTVPERLDDATRANGDVVWIDAGDAVTTVQPALHELLTRTTGPGILLTGAAAALPHAVGIEAVAPSGIISRTWRDDDDELFFFGTFTESHRLRGHASFRGHPLFEGLGAGTFTWWPSDGEPYRATTYTAPDWPQAGRVIAVERALIHINAARATIWEYDAGARRILCIGAYVPFASADRAFRMHLERLARNALRHAACPAAEDAHYWRLPDARVVHDAALPLPQTPLSASGTLPLEHPMLSLPGDEPTDPFTFAGRRCMIAGTEGSGVEEVWIHPVRAARDFSITADAPVDARVSPLGVTRRFRLGGALVTERVTTPRDAPVAVWEWTVDRAPAPIQLRVAWTADLRLMWPYPGGSAGALHWNGDERTLVVCGDATRDAVVFVLSEPVTWSCGATSRDGAAELRAGFTATLQPGGTLLLSAAASVDGIEAAIAASARGRDPLTATRARAASLQRLASQLSVDAPDARIGTAIEWAKARLASYLVETPGVGTSLIAGYWRSSPGWGDGRPGYAWYFGRDAVWTALASLAVGDFAASAAVLRFLAAHQDLSGRILHECTTSGVAHYDAADSTPLFLLLSARHHTWTADSALLAELWPAVQRAFDFCVATDTDGDGLIENTRVGHGWIEFGRLGGGKVTFYNAGIWVAALRELAVVAGDVGDATFAAELRSRAKHARMRLESAFHEPGRGYALKAWDEAGALDGRDFTPTATHAVPLLLGAADPDRAADWLDAVASDDFSADWGVRMIARSDPGFDPRSYHGGAVWPLYTGWISWAEYTAGRSAAAFRHWRATLDLAFERGKGAWDEVLHGIERTGIGVCPDQAWSTAAAVWPLVHGMLGVEPDAFRSRIRLRPQIPREWDRLVVRDLAMGDARFTFAYERSGDLHLFRTTQTEGAVPATLILEAAVPGRALRSAEVDGRPATLDSRVFGERILASVQLVLDDERTVALRVEG